MNDKENTEKLKNDIENYIKEKGWPGFFGLLATITPETVHQEDLEKYNANQKPYDPVKPPKMEDYESPYIDCYTSSGSIINKPIQEASIYAEEHIQAVQEDLMEQGQSEGISESLSPHKAKVLANNAIPSVHSSSVAPPVTPNPWGDAKTVSPGEVNDILTR